MRDLDINLSPVGWFLAIVTCLLVALKLCGVIAWSWMLIFFPMLIPVTVCLVLLLTIFVLRKISNIDYKRRLKEELEERR